MADSNVAKKEVQAEELAEREMEKDEGFTDASNGDTEHEITKDDADNMEEETNEGHEENLKEMTDVVESKEAEKDAKVSEEFNKEATAEEGRGPEEFRRETREERFAREEKEKLDNWSPKTELGRKVRTGKVKDIDEILDGGIKIMEPEIVDLLIPNLKTDTLFIGQAKGKFGGGKRRAFRQTQKKTKEGNVLTFGVMAVVGDGKGHVGIGYGRAAETLPAKEKAVRKAKMNIMKVRRGNGSFDDVGESLHSIPATTEGKCSSVTVKLMPAPRGAGLVVGDEMKKILRAVGITDIYSRTSGKTRTTFNTAKALMQALKKIGDIQE